MKPKKLILFDASGYLHRAYHAIPPLSTSKGEPVNAIYGFCRMISKVLKEDTPDFVGVCFDTAAPTFRHEQSVEYKATRSETDDALLKQLPVAEDLVAAWGLPGLKKDGFEADDVIATLAVAAEKAGMDVLILSGDKDILQLVSERVHVRDEIKRIEFGPTQVRDRYGFAPSQLVDYLCLLGDKIDNVPGVPGVGDKTASKLIAAHGSLEGIYEHLDANPPSLKEKLLAHKDRVFSNRSMINLKTDVPVMDVEKLTWRSYDEAALRPLLARLEFRGGLFGVPETVSEPDRPVNSTRVVHTVMTPGQLSQLDKKMAAAERLSYDLETDDLNTRMCGIVGVAISIAANESWYIPVGHRYLGAPAQLPWAQVHDVLKPHLQNPLKLKCGQNLKFDNAILARCGIEVKGPMFDTMLAAFCAVPGRNGFGLKDLAADFLNERMTRIDELIGAKKSPTFAEVSIEQAAPYAAADAEVVWRLVDVFLPLLKKEEVENLFHNLEMPLVPILQKMETAGISIDVPYLEALGKTFEIEQRQIESDIHGMAGESFVINSPKQLSRILFEKLNLPVIKKTKTGMSTDEDTLNKLADKHPIGARIIAYRELGKLISTYVQSLLDQRDPQTNRVHTSFNQTGAVTGRLSSSDPNLQNVPIRSENGRKIRRAFISGPGSILISADYSQIDLRALAHISGDPALIETFKQGGDVHLATASQMFHVALDQVTPDMRRSAKAINFGIVYGQQAYALSQSLGIELATAKDFIAKYFERYAGVRAWIESILAEARKTGFVQTIAGRRRRVPDINSTNAQARGFSERVAMNTPIQGSSADIIKYAMIRVDKRIAEEDLKTRMLLQVHDELVFEVPEQEEGRVLPVIREAMESAFTLSVPLVADIKTGRNWNDMQKIKLEVPA
jgi:DNA polymerase-1